jgi:SAM-dependent methyltransferase
VDVYTYNAIYQLETHHWWFVGRRSYVKNLLSRAFAGRDSLKLCEMGCGSGGNFKMLAGLGKIDAMEMDINTFQRAKTRGEEIKNVENVKNGWLPDNITVEGPYDAVVALDVIEHIEDDVASLVAIKEHIKPRGRLIITVPAYQWLWSPHDDANHHKRRYTKSLLKKNVEQAGYQVEYSSYFNTLLFPLSLLVRLVQKLSPSEKGLIDEFKMPSSFVNSVLTKVFSSESLLAGRLVLPTGLSIALVARV